MKLVCVLLFLFAVPLRAEEYEDAVAAELEALQGTYKVESMFYEKGKKIDLHGKLMIRDDVWKTGSPPKMKIKLDPTQNPKHLDLVLPDGIRPRVLRYIYIFKDDTLYVCQDNVTPDQRPAKFDVGGRLVVTIYKKIKLED
jgi:uncharacterized protein (TIGR03067 family)